MSTMHFSFGVLVSCWLAVGGCASRPESMPSTTSLSSFPACSSTVVTTVTPAKSTVRISYTEPSATTDGRQLTRLGKTTIYYDIGQGPVRAKDVPATKPTGGGHISQTITIPLEDRNEAQAKICVTATDDHGNEGPPTP